MFVKGGMVGCLNRGDMTARINDSILESWVRNSLDKIAEYGVDACSDKDITLACFGALAYSGLTGIREELIGLRSFGWKILIASVSTCITTLIAIILALMFIG